MEAFCVETSLPKPGRHLSFQTVRKIIKLSNKNKIKTPQLAKWPQALKLDRIKPTKAEQPKATADKIDEQSNAETGDPNTTVPHQTVAPHQVPQTL